MFSLPAFTQKFSRIPTCHSNTFSKSSFCHIFTPQTHFSSYLCWIYFPPKFQRHVCWSVCLPLACTIWPTIRFHWPCSAFMTPQNYSMRLKRRSRFGSSARTLANLTCHTIGSLSFLPLPERSWKRSFYKDRRATIGIEHLHKSTRDRIETRRCRDPQSGNWFYGPFKCYCNKSKVGWWTIAVVEFCHLQI